MVAATRNGPVGYTSFVHPTASVATEHFTIGATSLVDAFVSLEGESAAIGHGTNLQDNDRLLDHHGDRGVTRGNLTLGDGSFTAHGVTFVGRVRVGDACGTVINAVVQNASIGDASIVGFLAQVLGTDPARPIEIPEASLVKFGARIQSQEDVAANIIPVPTAFTVFGADVGEENLVLARGYNLLYRAASRQTPFSDQEGDPRNPGADFPDVEHAFGKLSLAPPVLSRRGTGAIPARQATLDDLGLDPRQPMSPMPTPGIPAAEATPPPDGADAAARLIAPRVASPELIADGAIVLGGCELAESVTVGPSTYVLGDTAGAVSIGRHTRIGRWSSVHELAFTSCRVGSDCVIGDRVVLHGPLEIGDHVRIDDGAVLFGPRVARGVTIGAGALVFGPGEITEDVTPGAVVVPPGFEGLVASVAHRSELPRRSWMSSMREQWEAARAVGRGCGCQLGGLAWV